MDAVTTLPLRGKTYLSGGGRTITVTDAAHLEGQVQEFDDVAPGQTPGAKVRRSDRRCVCMLVRNDSGIALLPKRVVKWKSDYKFKRVDGYCNSTAEEVAGVVDEHLPAAGCPDDDLFWVCVKGPSLVKTPLEGDGNNVITLNDVLIALTAVSSQATTSGRIITWGLTATSTGTTDGTYSRHLLNNFGRALSAKTTANTNADVLVDLYILKSA